MLDSVSIRLEKIGSLFEKARAIKDQELQSHLARYLCVYISGMIEQSVADVLADVAKKRWGSGACNFVQSAVLEQKGIRGWEKIQQLSKQIDKETGRRMEKFFDGRSKGALTSLSNNRNNIAHGKDTGLRLEQLELWFEQSRKMLEALHGEA